MAAADLARVDEFSTSGASTKFTMIPNAVRQIRLSKIVIEAPFFCLSAGRQIFPVKLCAIKYVLLRSLLLFCALVCAFALL